jgi:hypothetical protein
VIGPLTRALVERAREVVRWQEGCEPKIVEPHRIGGGDEHALSSGGITTEFRVEVNGPMPTTYIVTIAEVRGLRR